MCLHVEEGHCPLSLHPTASNDQRQARRHALTAPTLQKMAQLSLKTRFRWAKAHAQHFLWGVQPEYTETSPRSQVLLKSSTSYTISYTAAVPHILQEFWPSPGLLFRPIHPSIATSRLTNLQPCAANSAAVEDGNSPWTIWGLTELRARAPRPPHSRTKANGNNIWFYM